MIGSPSTWDSKTGGSLDAENHLHSVQHCTFLEALLAALVVTDIEWQSTFLLDLFLCITYCRGYLFTVRSSANSCCRFQAHALDHQREFTCKNSRPRTRTTLRSALSVKWPGSIAARCQIIYVHPFVGLVEMIAAQCHCQLCRSRTWHGMARSDQVRIAKSQHGVNVPHGGVMS
jgi:hypothetical protein